MSEITCDLANAPSRLSRIVSTAEWCVVVFMAIYLGGRTLPRAWETLGTDFPNYYLTAQLSREGVDSTRVYEWLWIQRQKDHRSINQPLVGLVPITPFSTLIVRPLTYLNPVAAKRCWILLNLCLLVAVCILMRSITNMEWRQIVFGVALNISLHRNLLYGQYYLLLLFVIVLACWCYERGRRVESGVLIGLSAGLKIFPILYFLYFLRKRDLRALAGGIAGIAIAAIASIVAFGGELNRVYMLQVLPWAFRGEGLNPYNVSSSSIASLLHRLFIYEPQWNPHPVAHIPWMFAVIHPLLQVLILGGVVVLLSPGVTRGRVLRVEWAAMLVAILAISTMPASYVFTLMIFPVCVFWRELQVEERLVDALVLLVLYLIVGVPVWNSLQGVGWHVLLGVPRLYALIGMCFLGYGMLWRGREEGKGFGRYELLCAVVMVCAIGTEAVGGLQHQRGLYADYAFRIPMPADALLASRPVCGVDGISFIAMLRGGYRVGVESRGSTAFVNSAIDQLGVSVAGDRWWIEEVGQQSNIIDANSGRMEVAEAESPVVAADGRRLAFLREMKGRSQLWIHEIDGMEAKDKPLTPDSVNVSEMAFLNSDELVFAADLGSDGSGLYAVDMKGNMGHILVVGARYPAVSPDGKWLAYSRLDGGNWNLWIKRIGKDQESRITQAACNSIEPTWDRDSKTIIYASDCGRALWFTALSRRRVLP
jgi:Glycosyltransferase family 87/WD40-like Beta Propeller Repeat